MLAQAEQSIRARVDAVLAEFLAGQRAGWADADRAPVFEAVRRFALGGGKRLRPEFCYWGWRGAGGTGPEHGILTAGAAIELFHCFALIHDDLMDRSDLRRGEATMQRTFAALHTRTGWRGDPDWYGEQAALLCGDLCASWSDELFDRAEVPAVQREHARRLFARMRAEAIAGQYLDLLGQVSTDAGRRPVERALRAVRYKTARYTVSRPLQIGAALAGADARLLAAYEAFGEPLGVTFQLRDDVLGVFGDPAITGKSVVDDLRAGKATVLVLTALERADERQAATLRSLVGDPALGPAGAAMVAEIVVATGALAALEQLIERHLAEALRVLATAPIPADVRAALAHLAERAAHRVV